MPATENTKSTFLHHALGAFFVIATMTGCVGKLKFHINDSCADGKIRNGVCPEEASTDPTPEKKGEGSGGGGAVTKVGKLGCKDPAASDISVGSEMTSCTGTKIVGTRTQSACVSNSESGCKVSGNFKAALLSGFTSNDVKTGVTIAGVTGTRALGTTINKCRNGVVNAFYNNNGLPGTGFSNASGSANQFDWWDTVLLFPNGSWYTALTGAGAAWSSSFYCDGSSFSTVTNSTAWLTPTSGMNCSGTTCTAANAFNAIFLESLTGLYVTNVLVEGVSGVSAPCVGAAGCADFAEAVSGCHNINSGDGVNKWRVPTQKELYLLFLTGMRNLDATLFASKLQDTFTSSTTVSTATSSVYSSPVHIYQNYNSGKTVFAGVFCVR